DELTFWVVLILTTAGLFSLTRVVKSGKPCRRASAGEAVSTNSTRNANRSPIPPLALRMLIPSMTVCFGIRASIRRCDALANTLDGDGRHLAHHSNLGVGGQMD